MSKVDAGGPQSAAAGAEPWPSDEWVGSLISGLGFGWRNGEPPQCESIGYTIDRLEREIRSRVLTLPPSPEHRAALERAEKAEADVESERNLAALWRGRATLALADLAQSQAECAALLRPQPESGPQAGTVTEPYGVIGHRVCGCAPTKEKP